MGILGYGRIGKGDRQARRSLRHAHRLTTAAMSSQALRTSSIPSLIEMARDCDVLVAICPGGPATRHIVNAEVLKALGPDGTLINVARGSVVG